MRTPVLLSRVTRSLGAVALLGLLCACSGEISIGAGSDVESDQLKQHIVDNFEPDEGVELTVDCPETLAADVDATASCTVDDGESVTGVRFTTTEVDGSEVSFDAAPFLSPEELSSKLTETLEAEGYDIEEMTCPDELPGVVEAATECSVTSQGETSALAVTVEEIDGLRFRLGWETGA